MPYDTTQVTEFRVTKVDAELSRKFLRLCQLEKKSRNQGIKDLMTLAVQEAEAEGYNLE